MWHYLYFIVLIKVKDPTEFTGPESYVYAMVKVRKVICHRPAIYIIQIMSIDVRVCFIISQITLMCLGGQ